MLGRPKGPSPRRNRLQVMLTDEETALFDKRCRELFTSRSSQMRRLVLEYIGAAKPKPTKK